MGTGLALADLGARGREAAEGRRATEASCAEMSGWCQRPHSLIAATRPPAPGHAKHTKWTRATGDGCAAQKDEVTRPEYT